MKRKLKNHEINLLQRIHRHAEERKMAQKTKPYGKQYCNIMLLVKDIDFLLELIEESWDLEISKVKQHDI